MLALCSDEGTASTLRPFFNTPIVNTPSSVPGSQPLPRSNDVPPTTTAAIASNSMPIDAIGWPAFMRPVSSSAPTPAIMPPSA